MTHDEFISKLFGTFGKPKTTDAAKEYQSYFQRYKESELEIFWPFIVENYEYSTLPVIGKIEKLRKDFSDRTGRDLGKKQEARGYRVITQENIMDFPPNVQIEWAHYWLGIGCKNADSRKRMLGIIERYVELLAREQEEALMKAKVGEM